MAVISTPVNARLRFTYMGNLPDLRINGINPTANAVSIANFANGVQVLQSAQINDGFVTVEAELTED